MDRLVTGSLLLSIFFFLPLFSAVAGDEPGPQPQLVAAHQDDDEPAKTADERLTEQIRSSLKSLTNADETRYDGKLLTLVYKTPEGLSGDAEFQGANEGEHHTFDPVVMRMPRRLGAPIFGGNTAGRFVLRPHFKGSVTLEIDVLFQTMKTRSTFLQLIHADEKHFLASNFGVHGMRKLDKGRAKTFLCPHKTHAESPLKWVDRKAPKKLTLVFEAGDKKMTLKWAEPMGEYNPQDKRWKDELENEVTLDEAPAGGQVGFVWKDVKFILLAVKVSGTLDREWAAKKIGFETAGE